MDFLEKFLKPPPDPVAAPPDDGVWMIEGYLPLALRGFAYWYSASNGTLSEDKKPTKRQIEEIDLDYDRQLNTMRGVYVWLKALQDSEKVG